MSQNPFSKIPLPVQPDPRTITITEFSKYQSNELNRLNSSLRTYKKSLLYIGGTLALSALFLWWGNKQAHQDLFGIDSTYPNMKTEEEDILT